MVEMIQSRLGAWLHANRKGELSLETRPVDGIYEGNTEQKEISLLQVEITRRGVRIVAL
jgi:hypothetical protein